MHQSIKLSQRQKPLIICGIKGKNSTTLGKYSDDGRRTLIIYKCLIEELSLFPKSEDIDQEFQFQLFCKRI
jgi:hypothetical protein